MPHFQSTHRVFVMAQYADDCFFCELRRIFHFLRYGHPMKPTIKRSELTRDQLSTLFADCGIPSIVHMQQGQIARSGAKHFTVHELIVKLPTATENLHAQLISSMRKSLKNHVRITKDVGTVAFTYGGTIMPTPDDMVMLSLTVALSTTDVVTE